MENKISQLIENIKNSEVRELLYYWEEDKEIPKYVSNIKDLQLDNQVIDILNNLGIKRLYKHQYESIKLIQNKKNVILNAGTGSGKTEAFLIPIINDCLKNNIKCLAILIYPTKALALDQLERIKRLINGLKINVEKYDGDTPKDIRYKIIENPPEILITNPDMLHKNLKNDGLKTLLSTIKYIVFDEVHNYSGVFGSSVHYVIKRLKRIIKDPQFICLTATIGNPKKFVELLCGEEFYVVESGKMLKKKRRHLMIRPIHSKYSEAIYLARTLSNELKIKTLIFCDSHLSCELLKKIADFKNLKLGIHRAGINLEQRIDVEKKFKSSKYNVIVSTPTLELGIDIGDLGAIINLSIPPTFNRYLQRIGRAGRGNNPSFDILLISDDPISNYYANHPNEYYNSNPNPVFVDPENPEIIKRQLIALCIDSPLTPDEIIKLNSLEKQELSNLVDENLIQMVNEFYLTATENGIKVFNSTKLRGSGNNIIIKCKNKKIGEREKQLAIKELFTDAIYMSGGKDYKVIHFNEHSNEVIVKELYKRQNHYTKALFTSKISNFKSIICKNVKNITIHYGMGEISELVDGYIVKELLKNKTIVKKQLNKPLKYSFKTKMIYFNLAFNSIYSQKFKMVASHTIEHLLIHAGITLTGANISELGGVSYSNGSIFIHDGIPGGSGLSKLLFDRFDKVLYRAFEILKGCKCETNGCPNCTYSPYCGSNNEYLSKYAALQVLTDIMNEKIKSVKMKDKFKVYGKPIV
ncbi:MAG: DEAD/DEAH box helicase [Candidatus Helarchaeota archaeon]